MQMCARKNREFPFKLSPINNEKKVRLKDSFVASGESRAHYTFTIKSRRFSMHIKMNVNLIRNNNSLFTLGDCLLGLFCTQSFLSERLFTLLGVATSSLLTSLPLYYSCERIKKTEEFKCAILIE